MCYKETEKDIILGFWSLILWQQGIEEGTAISG